MIRKRRRLPHWHTPFGLYFVTFRLNDSVPAHLLLEWESALDAVERSGASDEVLQRARRTYVKRVEQTLDRGLGSRLFADERAARILQNVFAHDDRSEYDLIAWCVMPNHAHSVFRLLGRSSLDEVMKAWKSVSSRRIKAATGLTRRVWQEEYFDVLIRDSSHLTRAVRYVASNPERSNLRDWPWVGTSNDRVSELL